MTLLPSKTRRGRLYIKRWPEAGPKPGEPAHGFFMRVTLANHQDSAAAFGRKLDLAEPNDAEGCLMALSGYPKASSEDLASLRRWTPLFDAVLGVVNGQIIRRDDWTTGVRRFCAACLAEDAYHRTWFDFTFVHRCPFHGTPVTDLRPDGTRASFSTAETTYTPGGVQVARSAPRLETTPQTLEAYAVGRLGLMPFEEVPFLTAASLAEVVAVSDLLGRAAGGGWRNTSRIYGKERVGDAVDALANGFAALRRGPEGVKTVLRQLAAQAPPTVFGAKRLFGWLKPTLSNRERLHWSQIEGRRAYEPRVGRPADRRALFYEILELANAVALELGRHARRKHNREATAESAAMTMSEVAAEVGQTIDVVTGIAGELGLLLPHKGGIGTPFLMPRVDVPKIAEELESSVTRGEAAEMLGVSYDTFLHIARACSIPKVGSRWGQWESGIKIGYEDRFKRSTISRFLDSIPSAPMTDFEDGEMPRPWPEPINIPDLLETTHYDVDEFCRALFAGEIKAERTGRDRGLADFELWPNHQPLWHAFTKRCMSGMATRGKRGSNGMSMREAAALLEVEPMAIAILVAEGHFGGDVGDTSQNRLNRNAVVAFFHQYAVAKVFSDQLDCGNAATARRLRKRGIAPAITVSDPTLARGKQNIAFFFDREEVRKKLMLAKDPESTDGGRIVWKRLSAFLGQNQSAFNVRRIKGQCAQFSNFNRLYPIDVRYNFTEQPPCDSLKHTFRYSVRAQLALEGKNFTSRREEILALLRERTLWPEMEVEVDGFGLVARLTTRFIHYGSASNLGRAKESGMDFVARYSADDVEVIERMLYMLKGAFEPSDRPFDLRTFGAWQPVRYRPWADEEHRCQLVRPARLYRIPDPSMTVEEDDHFHDDADEAA